MIQKSIQGFVCLCSIDIFFRIRKINLIPAVTAIRNRQGGAETYDKPVFRQIGNERKKIVLITPIAVNQEQGRSSGKNFHWFADEVLQIHIFFLNIYSIF